MSDFEEYIKVNYPREYERQKRIYPDQSVEELYSEDYKMWQHQQAKIEKLENELSTTKQVLGNVIDMEVAKVDSLKAQLNNMEACYIEKKKECELLESNINNLTKQFSDCYEVAYAEYKKNADSYYSGKCDAFDLAEQLAGLALRGVNNLLTDARQKAEDQINNGARLTKHQIDL